VILLLQANTVIAECSNCDLVAEFCLSSFHQICEQYLHDLYLYTFLTATFSSAVIHGIVDVILSS